MKQTSILYVGLVIFLLLAIPQGLKDIIPIEGEWDISEQVEGRDYEQYLKEEHDFDYSDPAVYQLAEDIKSSTSTPEQAVKETIRYVARNIRYSSKISIPYCYEETASQVLKTKKGDCVSMSRLVTALLRAQGIPTRTMGGCLTRNRCGILFSAIPYLDAQTTPMTEDDFKKRGFLHEWVESWTPNQGWFIIEATSGQIYSMDCDTYLIYGYDSNRYDRCVIKDQSFWNECKVA